MVGGANRRLRFGALGLVCLGVFAALFARLWYLQVLNAPAYEHVAALTSTRTVRIPAPRGRILDRNGKVLVDNVPTKVVAIDRQALDATPNSDAVLSRVAALLNRFEHPTKPFTLHGIRHDLAVNQVGPFDPVPLAENVSDKLLVELIEHKSDYPGVIAETRLLRQYHYGNLAAQLLGRVGPISEAEWKAHEHDAHPYPKDAQVGLSGVEKSLEKYLRGTDGKRVVEVTPAGKVVRTVKTIPPVPGHDVELTIDIDAQATAEQALAAQVAATRATNGNPPVPGAAALLMQPGTGQIVAMASYPTFDPSLFVPSISESDWKALQAKSAHQPMLNRTFRQIYSPGSTFKLVTGLAGLHYGVVTPSTAINDTGRIHIEGCKGTNCYRTNDDGEILGTIELPMALTRSSNVYFFNIGQQLWLRRGTVGDDALQRVAGELGFGEKTGIDLPDEASGRVPTPASRRKLVEKHIPGFSDDPNWYTGTNMNIAIGQGDVLVTPLQLANAYAQFANGGDRYRPTMLLRVLKPFAKLKASGAPVNPADAVVTPAPVKIGHLDIQPDWHAAMLQGFSGVTANPLGTASSVFAGFPLDTFPVAGKTGTAQTSEGKFSNAFFVGFGPTSDPAYVGVATLEQAGYGASAAAPVVRAMLEPVATSGTWPTVTPTIPSTPPPATTTTTTTVPGGGDGGDGGPPTTAVTGQAADTAETTTTGSVAAGGR